MKTIITKTFIILTACVMFNCNCIISYAHDCDDQSVITENKGISVKGTEKIWRSRLYNGKKQKRLWSCADNCWITDHWIDV